MDTQAKVLFVDDDPQTLLLLRELFHAKYQIYTARNGHDALDIIRKERIHVIVSDQIMPEMLGHQLLKQVKEIAPNTMRILLTGYSDMAAIMSSINEGEVFRFVIKPWQPSEMRGIVDSAVEIAQKTLQVPRMAGGTEVTKSAHRPTGAAGLLLLDDDPQVQQAFAKRYSNKYVFYSALSLMQALDILTEHRIGVLVTETSVARENTIDLVTTLKQEYPAIVTIVQTAAVAPDIAVQLINNGQIHRYLRKPVKDSLMDYSIKNAYLTYHESQAEPLLMERHKAEPPVSAQDTALSRKISNRLRALGKKFTS